MEKQQEKLTEMTRDEALANANELLAEKGGVVISFGTTDDGQVTTGISLVAPKEGSQHGESIGLANVEVARFLQANSGLFIENANNRKTALDLIRSLEPSQGAVAE